MHAVTLVTKPLEQEPWESAALWLPPVWSVLISNRPRPVFSLPYSVFSIAQDVVSAFKKAQGSSLSASCCGCRLWPANKGFQLEYLLSAVVSDRTCNARNVV